MYARNDSIKNYFLIVLCAFIALSGCSKGEMERKWSEDVALDSGPTVDVDRYVKLKTSNSMAGDAYSAEELKSTLTIHEGTAELPTWDVALQPLVLYRDETTKEWVIVAASNRCEVWWARGRPTRPYWEYRLKSGGWTEVPLSNSSLGRKTNLYILYEIPPPVGHLTTLAKEQALSNYNVERKSLSIEANVDPNYCN